MTTWVAFDTETTGIEPGSRLLDLAAIAFDDRGHVISTFDQLVNPGMPVPADASAVHGITDRVLAGQPSAPEVLAAFRAWLPAKATLVAHNAPYDCDILTWELQHAGLPLPTQAVVDTCRMAKVLAETPDNKLQTLVEHYRLTRSGHAHRALPDADAVRQYFTCARSRLAPESAPWSARCSCPARLPPAWRELPVWIAGAIPVRIRYTDAQGQITERTFTPYGYAMTGSGLRMHGWCHQADSRRTFYPERAVVLRVEQESEPTRAPKNLHKSLLNKDKKVSRS